MTAARVAVIPACVVLVSGGRAYDNRARVFEVLDHYHARHPIALLIHGGASGADTLADIWARDHGVPRDRHPVTPEHWRLHGKKAGPQRNQRMVDLLPGYPGRQAYVLCFPGGAGTADLRGRAIRSRHPVIDIADSGFFY